MAEILDFTALKRGGFIKQRQAGYFSVRLRVPGGFITPAQLRRLEEASNQYGRGVVHLTSRQGVEIPWVRPEDFEAMRSDLAEVDLIPAGCGPRVRNVMSCPGASTCAHGLVDSRALAEEIDARYFGLELPVKKFKIAISGCPNSCTTPQVNDVGLVGIQEPVLEADLCTGCSLCVEACRERGILMRGDLPERNLERCLLCGDCVAVCPFEAWLPGRSGFALYLGGKVGRHPQFGVKVAEFLSPVEVLGAIDSLVSFVQEFGNPKERFGALLNQVGLDELTQRLGLEVVR